MFDNVNMTLIKENISFAGNNAVFKGDNTIPELQCKGVTALCKILQGRQYAYLADEVGMGKTYQAIGVISMLLAEKKNAKILVIAPNEAVQRNWINEFRNFSHGAIHGAIAGIGLALPMVTTNALFERKGFKYIAINSGYWIVCLILMGGFICQFADLKSLA